MWTNIGRGSIIALCLLVSGVGAETQADNKRRSPVVNAVVKTREGILTVNSYIQTNWGKKKVVGTAVIVDKRGIAVTALHVIGNDASPTLILFDGTELVSVILVEDKENDLAILSLPSGRTYHELTFASGKHLLVGEAVISVGSPYGYSNSVSTGILSALDREIDMPSGAKLRNIIQHNAATNSGNSGGPLFNINGELIGINVAVREDSQGIAFAINVDTVKQVLTTHLSALKVAKIRHGLTCRETIEGEDEAIQRLLVVEAVNDSSPAAEVLKQDDVIVKLGSVEVSNRFDLERAFWNHDHSKPVQASILRDGELKLVSLEFQAPKPIAKNPQPAPPPAPVQPTVTYQQPVNQHRTPVLNYGYSQTRYPYDR